MNNQRRKELERIISILQDTLGALQNILSEEEDYMDNIPENLQGGERYSVAEEACDNMSAAIDAMEEAIDCIRDAQV